MRALVPGQSYDDLQERFDRLHQAASSGDDYGIKRHMQYGVFQVCVAQL